MAPPPPPTAATATLAAGETLPREPSSTIETTRLPDVDAPLGKVAGYEQIIRHFYSLVPAQKARKYEFEHLKAGFPEPETPWPALKEIPIPEDRGLFADPEYKELFEAATKVEHINPTFGTIIYGVSLAKLNDKQKDELARLVAFRGVVFFRDQDEVGVDELIELGEYYGPLQRTGSTPVPIGAAKDEKLYNIHVVDATEKRPLKKPTFSQTDLWHSDVTFELQPASYTFLKLLQGPPVGGDTYWNSSYATYDEVSRPLAEYLEKLTASHSSQWQIDTVRASGFQPRREAVTNSHPIVRTHPVTGWKSVFVNPLFTTKIDGVSRQESDAILNHVYQVLTTNIANSVRWKWRKNDIAVWDNRSTNHAGSYGTYPHYRHAVRVTVTGETPVFNGGVSQGDFFAEQLKDLSL